MRAVLNELKRQGLFFVDSRTIASSVGNPLAQQLGVPTANRDFFLDNSTDHQAIREEIHRAINSAAANGSAIAICHARPDTAATWEAYMDEFEATGITFVPVTELLY